MATLANLVVRMSADTAALQKGIKDAQSKTSGLGKTFKTVGTVAAGFLSAQVIGGGVQKLTGFLSDCTAKAKEQAAVEAQLGAVLKSTGGAAGVTADEAKKLAAELQKTTNYGDEATLAAENMLLTFTNIGKEVFPDTTKAVLDMSTAMGQSLQQTAVQVGKALQDPVQGVTALQRVGVRLTESQKDMVKSMVEVGDVAGAQKLILHELAAEFSGSAEAAVAADGGMTQMSNRMGDLQEKIGAKLLPVMVKWKEIQLAVFEAMMKLGPYIQSFADEWLPRLKAGVDLVKDALSKAMDALAPLFDKVKPLAVALDEAGAASAAAAAVIGTVLVVALGAATVAAWNFAVAMLATGVPEVIIGIAALGAAIAVLVTHWDDVTAAVERARDWFLDLPVPIKAVAIALGGPIVALVALGVGINQLVTHWDASWLAIRQVTETAVNGVIAALNVALGAIEATLNGIIRAYNETVGRIPGVDKIGQINITIAKIDLTPVEHASTALENFQKVVGGTTDSLGTGLAGGMQKVAGRALELMSSAKQLGPSLGPGIGGSDGVGSGAGAAAKGLDDAAKAALETRKAFVELHGSITLLSAMNYEATITELRLSDAMRDTFGASADLIPLWQEQISILQPLADDLRGTGEANDILADAIGGTIQGLQDQIDAVGGARDALILMGEDAVGPVADMFKDMLNSINGVSSAISGLGGIQTEEEANLEAAIAGIEAQIAGLKRYADSETSAGKAAQDHIDALEKQKDPLQKQLDFFRANKDAVVAFMDAQIEGRPTMDELTGTIFAQGQQLGIWGGEVEKLPPTLRAWYLAHAQTVFDIMLNFNHLLLNQRTFTDESSRLATDWAKAWQDAAAGVAGALAGVSGGEPAAGVGVPSAQHGAYITSPGLIAVHAGESVVPAGGISGGGGGRPIILEFHNHAPVLADRRDLMEWVHMALPEIKRQIG